MLRAGAGCVNERTNTEGAGAEIQCRDGKAGCRETRRRGSWVEGNKRAANMREAMQPGVRYVHGKKNAARPEHAKNFAKRGVLSLGRFQMMKHQHGNYRGKCLFAKRQCGRIALNRFAVGAYDALLETVSLDQFGKEMMTVFEASHASRALSQFFRCRACSRANFQNMIAYFRPLEKPWEEFSPGHPPPEGRSTEPIFEPVHSKASLPALERTTTMIRAAKMTQISFARWVLLT